MPDYCPKCGSRLYPLDGEYIRKYGVCSYCITFHGKKKPVDPAEEETKCLLKSHVKQILAKPATAQESEK